MTNKQLVMKALYEGDASLETIKFASDNIPESALSIELKDGEKNPYLLFGIDNATELADRTNDKFEQVFKEALDKGERFVNVGDLAKKVYLSLTPREMEFIFCVKLFETCHDGMISYTLNKHV